MKTPSFLVLALILLLVSLSSAFAQPVVIEETEAWPSSIVDGERQFGVTERSLAVDAAGHPHLAYAGRAMYYAYHDGAAWRYEVPAHSSSEAALALDADGHPHITTTYGPYVCPRPIWDEWCFSVYYLAKDETGWRRETVFSPDGYGGGSSTAIALDASDQPHVLALPPGNERVAYAYRDAGGWHTETVHEFEGAHLWGLSLAIAANGAAHAVWTSEVLPDSSSITFYATRDATGWHVEPFPRAGNSFSLALDANGAPVVAFRDAAGVQLATREGESWRFEPVDGQAGSSGSVSLGDATHVSYDDATQNTLKVATKEGSGWRIESIENSGGYGVRSMAVGPDGAQYVSATTSRAGVGSPLMLMRRPATATAWEVEQVDVSSYVEDAGSLAAGPTGFAHIAYRQAGLKHAYQDVAGWHSELVDAEGQAGKLAVGGDGVAHMAYLSAADDVRYGRRDPDLAAWQLETIAAGERQSLALSSDGLPRIIYAGHGAETGLFYAFKETASSAWQVEVIDAQTSGQGYSYALDPDDRPHVSYISDGDSLQYAFRDAAGWHVETVNTLVSGFWLKIDRNGLPHLVYRLSSGELKHAYRDAAGWQAEIVDTGPLPGISTLAIDSNGEIHFLYTVEECSSDNCTTQLRYAFHGPSGWIDYALTSWGSSWITMVTPTVSMQMDGNDRPHVNLRLNIRRGVLHVCSASLSHLYQDGAGWHQGAAGGFGCQEPASLFVGADNLPRISYAAGGQLIYTSPAVGRSRALWLPLMLRDSSEPSPSWQFGCVDCPPTYTLAGLTVDPAARPRLAYTLSSDGMTTVGVASFDGAAWQTEVVAASPGALTAIALAQDRAGQPYVSFYDASTRRIKLAQRAPGGAGWQIDDDANPIGPVNATALAIGTDGTPHIGYASGGQAFYAWRDADGWRIETVDPIAGAAGVSIALDSGGQPRISYVDTLGKELRYAERTAMGWQVLTLEASLTGAVSGFTSLALTGDDTPHLSYARIDPNGYWDLRHVYRLTDGWHAESLADSSDLARSSMAVDNSNVVHVIFDTGPGLVYVRNDAPGHWESVLHGSSSSSVTSLALALDAAGVPHVAYQASDSSIPMGVGHAYRMATAVDGSPESSPAASWQHETVLENGGILGNGLALAVGGDGQPVLSYSQSIPGYGARTGSAPDSQGDVLVRPRLAARDGGAWRLETLPPLDQDAPIVITSVALDGANAPHVSYHDSLHSEMTYAHRDGASWVAEPVSDEVRNPDNALAVDSLGRPMVAFFRGSHPMLATRGAAGWQVEAIQSLPGGPIDGGIDLDLDSTGQPHALYSSGRDLSYAWQDGSGWHAEVIDSIGEGGRWIAESIYLALDSAGQPHASYQYSQHQEDPDNWVGGTKVAYRDANGWHIEEIASTDWDYPTAFALDQRGAPHLVLWLQDSLYHATREQGAATWRFDLVPIVDGSPGRWMSLAVDQNDQLLLAYQTERQDTVMLGVITLPPPGPTPTPGASPTPTVTPSATPTRTPTASPSPTASPAATPTATRPAQPDSAVQVTAGDTHTCALTEHGGIKCWGHNAYGQLGNGTTTDRYTPVDVSGLSSGVRAVVAGGSELLGHTCAVTEGRGVKCWGYNDTGQLGDDTRTNRTAPVDVVGLSSGIRAITAGGSHTCALTEGGGVKCWGDNYYGQLGDGTTSSYGRWRPVDVSGLSSGVRAIAAGFASTCAVTEDGGVKCWGRNNGGQLGDGTTINRTTPVDVVGMGNAAAAIAAGYAHTCALTEDGGIKCWGRNEGGQLGDGTTSMRTTPVDVVGLGSGVQAIAVGANHTCALTEDNGAKCWGYNQAHQLGDGTWTFRWTPVDVTGLSSGARAIETGGDHSCVLIEGGGVQCWGDNGYGQLGIGRAGRSHPMPVAASGLTSGMRVVAAGGSSQLGHTCAVTEARGIMCWGVNSAGQLGDGTTIAHWAPVDVSGLNSGVDAVIAGDEHTCATVEGGGVLCWGWNRYGQLGDGTADNRTTPVGVAGLNSGISTVAAGWGHTCALTDMGELTCWGANMHGQVGDGTNSDRATPVNVIGLSSGVRAVGAGNGHTCALTEGGGIKCWGWNGVGQLGDGTSSERWTPVDVMGLSSGMRAVAAGNGHTCALTEGGGVKCWGANSDGQLGDGTRIRRYKPVDVIGLGDGIRAITAGGSHTCALTEQGSVKCWGWNGFGQLGDGTTITHGVPVDVSGLGSDIQAIAAGESHTCAIAAGGWIKCWGDNGTGQLGINPGWTPVDVEGFGGRIRSYLPLIMRW